MSSTIKLPDLKCTARRNFCSSVIGVCNRVFALYQVDTPDKPFWVMEMDHVERYALPLRGMTRFNSHIDALSHLHRLALSALGGDPTEVYLPSRLEHDDTPAIDDTFHRIEMEV